MLNNFLYIIIGMAVSIPIPHFQTIGNALLSGNRELLMSELAVTWQSLIVVIPAIVIIALVLGKLDKRKEAKRKQEDDERTKKLVTSIITELQSGGIINVGDKSKPPETK